MSPGSRKLSTTSFAAALTFAILIRPEMITIKLSPGSPLRKITSPRESLLMCPLRMSSRSAASGRPPKNVWPFRKESRRSALKEGCVVIVMGSSHDARTVRLTPAISHSFSRNCLAHDRRCPVPVLHQQTQRAGCPVERQRPKYFILGRDGRNRVTLWFNDLEAAVMTSIRPRHHPHRPAAPVAVEQAFGDGLTVRRLAAGAEA